MVLRLRTVAALAVVTALVGAFMAVSSAPAVAQETTTVAVGDLFFCDESFQSGVCETTVTIGDTVAWNFSDAALPHTTSACGASCDAPDETPLWDSGIIDDGSAFEFTFDEAGTFLYRCDIHPAQMRGQIVVEEAQVEPPGDGDGDDDGDGDGAGDGDGDGDGDGADDTGVVAEVVPATGQGPGNAATSDGLWLALAALTAGGMALFGIGTLAYRRVR